MAQEWKNGFIRFAEWFSRLTYLNLLWILYTIFGLVILGFIPSTVALFSVMRRWMKGDIGPQDSVFKLYWMTFKKEFFKSNVTAFIPVVIGYVIYIDLYVVDYRDTMLMQSIKFLVYIFSFYYLLVMAFFFPVYVHYHLKWHQYLKMTFLMPFVKPFRGVLMLLLGYGMIFLMSKMPILFLFLLGSAIAYLWLMVSLPTFAKLEQKHRLRKGD